MSLIGPTMVCPKCGTRNQARGGVATRCRSCDGPPPKGHGFEVNVEGMQRHQDGPIIGYRVRLIGPDGALVVEHPGPLRRGVARRIAKKMSERVAAELERAERQFLETKGGKA